MIQNRINEELTFSEAVNEEAMFSRFFVSHKEIENDVQQKKEIDATGDELRKKTGKKKSLVEIRHAVIACVKRERGLQRRKYSSEGKCL